MKGKDDGAENTVKWKSNFLVLKYFVFVLRKLYQLLSDFILFTSRWIFLYRIINYSKSLFRSISLTSTWYFKVRNVLWQVYILLSLRDYSFHSPDWTQYKNISRNKTSQPTDSKHQVSFTNHVTILKFDIKFLSLSLSSNILFIFCSSVFIILSCNFSVLNLKIYIYIYDM